MVNEVGINYGVGWNERLTVTAGGVPFRLQGSMFAMGIAGNRPQDDKEIAISALKNAGAEPIA